MKFDFQKQKNQCFFLPIFCTLIKMKILKTKKCIFFLNNSYVWEGKISFLDEVEKCDF